MPGKKIDSQMLQIYQNTVSGKSGSKKIQEQDALVLIKRAETISKHTIGNCFCRPEERRGSKYLMRLITAKGKHFTNESRQLIRQYINSGRIPSVRTNTNTNTNNGYTGFINNREITYGGENVNNIETTSTRRSRRMRENSNNISGNTITNGPSLRSLSPVSEIRRSGNIFLGNNTDINNNIDGTVGNDVVSPNIENNAPVNNVTNEGGISSVDGVVLDWKAQKPTWHCHWFPMQESIPGGDITNNLYSVNGSLDKLDKLTGGKARIYEWEHNRKSKESGPEYSWWGHCNNASEASCLLKAPKHGVVMKGVDGTDIKFTKNDIQGLLVKVVPNLVAKTDFKGERFNVSGRDNPNDPSPEVFMNVIKEWSKEGMPFVLDIDPSAQVWNFPYDQVKITESNTAPEGVNVPNDGNTKYYHIEMAGTGYDEKKRVYECYVTYGDGGSVLSSGWLKTGNSHNNPDFMWRPHPKGDLMDKSLWVSNGKTNNPEVDPQVVYDLYMSSLS